MNCHMANSNCKLRLISNGPLTFTRQFSLPESLLYQANTTTQIVLWMPSPGVWSIGRHSWGTDDVHDRLCMVCRMVSQYSVVVAVVD